MSEIARFFFMQITLLAVVLVLHTYLGLHIIRRTLVFSDLVLDQLAALGVLLGLALHLEYGTVPSHLVSLGAVLLGALALALIKPARRAIPREAVIGIMYALALIASLLLGDKLSEGEAYITKTMSGSLLWVSWPLIYVTVAVYIVLLLFHYKFRRQFISLVEAPDALKKERLWDFLFFVTQGIITVLIVPIAGVLLAYALLMIPAAIAILFTKRWALALLLGWAVGLAACVAGLCSSYFWNLPYSPSLILCLGIVFLGALFLRVLFPNRALTRTKGDA